MSGSEHLPIAENSEICYVTSLCHFKDFKKIFKMNIFFFFYFASACPHFSLCFPGICCLPCFSVLVK